MNSLDKKDKEYFQTQERRFKEFLKNNIATSAMASKALGIPDKNICRYKRTLEKNEKLWVLFKKPCEVTRNKAWYLTTNPEIAETYLENSKKNTP